jgi:hypothetical protein
LRIISQMRLPGVARLTPRVRLPHCADISRERSPNWQPDHLVQRFQIAESMGASRALGLRGDDRGIQVRRRLAGGGKRIRTAGPTLKGTSRSELAIWVSARRHRMRLAAETASERQKEAGVGACRHRQGSGWQTRDRETLPSRTAKEKASVRRLAGWLTRSPKIRSRDEAKTSNSQQLLQVPPALVCRPRPCTHPGGGPILSVGIKCQVLVESKGWDQRFESSFLQR